MQLVVSDQVPVVPVGADEVSIDGSVLGMDQLPRRREVRDYSGRLGRFLCKRWMS
jgi:hypothetical protein